MESSRSIEGRARVGVGVYPFILSPNEDYSGARSLSLASKTTTQPSPGGGSSFLGSAVLDAFSVGALAGGEGTTGAAPWA